jgi:hypothetical protein
MIFTSQYQRMSWRKLTVNPYFGALVDSLREDWGDMTDQPQEFKDAYRLLIQLLTGLPAEPLLRNREGRAP